MVYPITKRILWPILRLFVHKIEGLENIPKGQFILAANHHSFVDGPLLIMMLAWFKDRQLIFFATKESFTGPIWSAMFNHFGAIRVNGSLDKALNALKKGKNMGIFPEAERVSTKKPKEIRRTGLGVLALKSRLPVVPVGLHTYHFWNVHQLIPTFKRNIMIRIGKPMKFKGKPTKANIKKTMDKIWKEVKQLARTSHP